MQYQVHLRRTVMANARTKRLTSSSEFASNPEDELTEVFECVFKPFHSFFVSRGPCKYARSQRGETERMQQLLADVLAIVFRERGPLIIRYLGFVDNGVGIVRSFQGVYRRG